jgi:cysteine-rich repeat protein
MAGRLEPAVKQEEGPMKQIGLRAFFSVFLRLAAMLLLAAGCYESAERETRDGSTPDLYVPDHPEEPVIAVCGNGIVEGSEECDDGNADECDGCTSLCRRERAMQVDSSPGARTAGPVPCQQCPITIEMWFRVDNVSDGLFSLFSIPQYMSIGPR